MTAYFIVGAVWLLLILEAIWMVRRLRLPSQRELDRRQIINELIRTQEKERQDDAEFR